MVMDVIGYYFLKNFFEGNFVFEVSLVGYKIISCNVSFRKGKIFEENFELEEDVVVFDGVVVLVNCSVIKWCLVFILVNVVDMKMFENINLFIFLQGFNFQFGVWVEMNCQNCGFQQVCINGLDGLYIQIFIDLCFIFSVFFGVYGLEQIFVNMIEWVEVM